MTLSAGTIWKLKLSQIISGHNLCGDLHNQRDMVQVDTLLFVYLIKFQIETLLI
jgi:hypothetical protein